MAKKEIAKICNQILLAYPTTLETDIQLLSSTTGFAMRNLILLRMEEKIILKRVIQLLSGQPLSDDDWNVLIPKNEVAPKIEILPKKTTGPKKKKNKSKPKK